MRALFVRTSENRKTGPMPVVITSSDTCPTSCPLKGKGCYGSTGPLNWIWKGVDDGRRGGSWEELLEKVKALPRGQVFRYAVVGDLPGEGDELDTERLGQLVEASRGKKAFAYSHKPMTEVAAEAVRKANKAGFTINLSACTLAEADALAELGVGPVVVSTPKGSTNMVTPGGRRVVVCPAYHKEIDCLTCQLCAKAGRKTIVSFPAHGTKAKQVKEVFSQA